MESCCIVGVIDLPIYVYSYQYVALVLQKKYSEKKAFICGPEPECMFWFESLGTSQRYPTPDPDQGEYIYAPVGIVVACRNMSLERSIPWYQTPVVSSFFPKNQKPKSTQSMAVNRHTCLAI